MRYSPAMKVKVPHSSQRHWWLNIPLLVTGFVVFMVFASIAGSIGTQKERTSGNDFWKVFLTRPLVGLDELAVIGTWRHDRQPGVAPRFDHCGIKVYALPPRKKRNYFEEPVPDATPWERPAAVEPLNSLTRMSASFCDGPDQLTLPLFAKISAAWGNLANERFCERYGTQGAIFAGVIDREKARVYTWFSVPTARPGEGFAIDGLGAAPIVSGTETCDATDARAD